MSRTYRTKEQARTYWQDVFSRWQKSGLSVHRFCREHQICESGFYTWRKKLSLTALGINTTTGKCPKAAFVQVDMPRTTPSQLTLELTSGHTLHISDPVNSQTLATVLQALHEAKLC